METTRLEGESELQYIWRLCLAKDSGVLELTWTELADIFNKELCDDTTSLTESAYRKKFQQAKAFYEDVFSKMKSDEYKEEVMSLKRELERSKIQYRDERNAWQKQNYIEARVEQKLDYLEEQLMQMGKINFQPSECVKTDGDNDLLIMLSDLHIGQCFSSVFGEYNSDIARERLTQYLCEIIKIAERHGSENAFVSIQGDLISGSIHHALAVTNRENVIEQIQLASELISAFCSELSKYFKHVTITNVSGNHSRIDKKDDALHDERLDNLIGWIVEKSLSHLNNVEVLSNNIDTGLSLMRIRDLLYVNVHGDYDSFTKNGLANLVLLLGCVPYAVTFGHLHTCAVAEYNGIKMIRSGSLAGSGDSYTIEKRLKGKPSQMVCVCSKNGVEAYYPVELN